MDIKEKVKSFLNDTGATVTAFCKRIDISPTYYYKWINDNVKFSNEIIDRIIKFLDEVYAK